MKLSREKTIALCLLAASLLFSIIGLWPELTISRVDLNDNVFHFPLIQGMVNAVEHGSNPFDWWAPQWSLGYPVLRTYQPLAHAMVAAIYFALFKSVSLMTVFVWVRYLSVILLPLTFFITARLLSFSPLTAGAAAILAPLISSSGLYGIEYGSYVWAGSGLFTQAVACHFLLLTIGFGYRAIRRGRPLALTGVLLGLTFLSHFIYGYMGALTICLLALMPAEIPRAVRLVRLLWIGAVAFALSLFELLPLWLDGSIIDKSRWEPAWKWDSFGAGHVLKLLFTGEVLDHGRLPVFSLLALAGIVVYFVQLRGQAAKFPARTFVIWGAALWILMFFGRPFWGPLLVLVGVSADMQLHRVSGGVQIFLVLLAAIGLAGIWREFSRRKHVIVVGVLTLILFYPMVRERSHYLANNKEWGFRSLAAYKANKNSIDNAISIAKERDGRAYAGLAAAWGGQFKIGDPPFHAYLSAASVPALSFLYHSMSLTSETMTRFNEFSEAHYRLFNIHTVIAPPGVNLPEFLKPIDQFGPLRILAAPDTGYFDVVDVFYAVLTTPRNFYDINDRWQQSNWVANRQHLLLDFEGGMAPAHMVRLSPGDPLPGLPPFPFAGTILSQGRDGDAYTAELQAARSSYVLFKMTWHPNWHALVDGHPVKTAMLSPGFVGVPVTGGRHRVELRYEPEAWRWILAIAGMFAAALAVVVEKRRGLPQIAFAPAFVKKRWLRPVGLIALALPVCVALFTTGLPGGHDATEYLPRLVEFHRNIAHGILLPRWAPDLSNGTGQPLFLFNPPMLYYIAEFWHLLGFNFVTALNAACIAIVLASAIAMFLFGRLYFGEMGGWLAAASYLYAPYFAVNLYVRSAMAEFAAFPFFALALYGFGAYAKRRSRPYLAIGAASYAGVLLCHNPAALLFSPLLGAFIVFTARAEKSWKIFRHQAYGVLLGLGLAAFVWLPSVVLNSDIQVQSLFQGYSNYTNHFVYLHQLFDSAWGYGLSLPGDRDGMSFALGLGQIAVALIACIWAARRGGAMVRRWLWFFGVAAALLCFMILQAAAPIWGYIRPLQYIAFPWRWLGPIAVAIAAMAAALGPMIQSMQRWRRIAFAGAMALLILPNLSHLHFDHVRDMDLTFWTPEEIATRGIEVSSLGEYRPRWMQTAPKFDPRPAEVVSGYAQVQQSGRTPVSWMGRIQASTQATVEMQIAYFPGWQVRIDGAPAAVQPAENTGLIRFQIGPGNHAISVVWRRTPVIWIADLISVLAFLLLIATAIPGRRTPRDRKREIVQPSSAIRP